MTTSHPVFETNTGRDHKNAAGSSQSADRDRAERAAGTVEARKAMIVALVRDAGLIGMTWKEVSDVTGLPHQKVTPALSNLHQDGVLVALRHDKRNGSGVYVTPEHVASRIVRTFRHNNSGNTEAQRPRLTAEEVTRIADIRAGLAQQSDQPVIRIRRETLRLLLAAIERLNK
jgi:hypothetical protein